MQEFYLDEIQKKLSKGNKILFNRDSICLQGLVELIKVQKRTTLVLWAFESMKSAISLLNCHYPDDKRPNIAYELCQQWAYGLIKMPLAKKAILSVHAMAKSLTNNQHIALCHAIGQGLSTIHTPKHAIGLPIYELSSIVFEHGIEKCKPYLEEKIKFYEETLKDCIKKIETLDYTWAIFLTKNTTL